MDNKKAIIDKAKENGVLERVSMLLSAAYLLNSESSVLVEEASDVLNRNGMRMGEIKMFHQRFTKSADMYFNFAVFENKQVGKYGDTHMIKQSIDKDARSKMSDEEKRAIPILGNMKPMEFNNATHAVEPPVAPVSHEDDDSLPF